MNLGAGHRRKTVHGQAHVDGRYVMYGDIYAVDVGFGKDCGQM